MICSSVKRLCLISCPPSGFYTLGELSFTLVQFSGSRSNNTNPIKVATLAPAVQTDPLGNISVAGGLPIMTSFSLDGVSTQQVRFGGPSKDLFPSVESIGEFKVNTAGNNAEFSQMTDLTVTTKSGGNDYHGALFWFHQNAALNSRDTFSPTKAPLVPNDFGATASGPLSIPGVYNGRDKTFVLFTYEGTRRPQSFVLSQLLPPTIWRTGDMSSLCGSGFDISGVCRARDSNGNVINQIFDPATGNPFMNNQVPVNPVSAKILAALFEQPNDPTNTDISNPNFFRNQPGTFTVNGYDGRIDHVFGPNHKVFGRVTWKDIRDVGIANDPGYNTKLGPFSTITEARNVAGSYNWIARPNLINEFRAGVTQFNVFTTYPVAAQGAALDQSFGIVGLPRPAATGGIGDYTVGGFIDTNPEGRPDPILNRIYHFSDSLTWIKGKHTVKGGAEFRKLKYQDYISFTNGDEFGDYTFDGSFTAPPLTNPNDATAFADFLLGRPANTDFALNGPNAEPFGYHYGGYIQDDWKFRPNLTVSYGVRYEVNVPFDDETDQLGQLDRNFVGPAGVRGRMIVQDQKALGEVAPSWRQTVTSFLLQVPGYDVTNYFVTAQQAGLNRHLRGTFYGNIQPRLGFAWRPFNNEKTVVRSSFGSYSVPVLGAVLYSLEAINTSNFVSFVSTPSNPLILPNAFGGTAVAPSCPPACPGFRRANQLDLQDPRAIQWNFSVEHVVGWKTLLRLNYTGSHTTKLIYSPDLNQLPANTVGYAALAGLTAATPAAAVTTRLANLRYPNFAEVLTRDGGPSAKYNAFTAEAQRRFTSDLNFDFSYT